jgi:5-methylcytosine-specific restriction enzyme B
MKTLVVYVGQNGTENYVHGLKNGIWGFRPKKSPPNELSPGDWIVFGRGFKGGAPRTTEGKWMQHSLEEIAFARITSGLVHGTAPEWPDEIRSGIITYSERLRFDTLISQRQVRLADIRPIEIAKALRRSAISGKGYLVIADNNPTIETDSFPPPPPTPPIDPPEILSEIENYIRARGFNFDTAVLHALYASLRAKPFVILAGNSGTGKSRLARLFAEAIGANTSNGQFRMIPVRPDWNDSSDLLGYFDLNGDFRPGHLIPTLLLAHEQPDKLFFICLDEMNLARVEHYFSDFLSVLESRRKESGQFVTDVVLREDQIARMIMDPLAPCAAALSRRKTNPRPLGIPPNLFIVGTVNMDETTQPFSRKVLDRANTIEFNDIDLMEGVNEDLSRDEVPSLDPGSDFLKGEFASLVDIPSDKKDIASHIASFLQEVNRSLVIAGFEVGYRVRDESIAFTIYGLTVGMSMEEVKENIILQKVLPRLQGSSPRIEKALISLMQQFAGDEDISEPESPGFSERLISLRTHSDASPVLRKIAGMLLIFREEGFTSYWLA